MNLAEIIGRITTNNFGRAVLGITASALQGGYSIIEQDPEPSEKVKESWKGPLDVVNAYAQGIYATLPANDEPIAFASEERIRLALSQTDSVLSDLSSDVVRFAEMREQWLTDMGQVLPDLGGVIGNTVAGIVKAPAEALTALVWPVAIVLAVVLVFLMMKKGIV